MVRNFCGFVDFENQTNPQVTIQMAEKLNINQLYESRPLQLSKAYFVNVYSKSFAASRNSDFLKQMESRYRLTSFSLLIRLAELGKKLGFDFNHSEISDEEFIFKILFKMGQRYGTSPRR